MVKYSSKETASFLNKSFRWANLSLHRRDLCARVPTSSIKLKEILREIESAIKQLEVLEYEVKREFKRCAMIGV
jgi:hypothetical protein